MQSRHEPLVSVIIPSFNSRRWVCAAIESVLVQSYPQIEVIVVDDGSSDGTGELLSQKYGERIRYHYQRNRGLSSSRNEGLRLARGQYVQFLDADDVVHPEKFATQVACLRENGRHHLAYSDFDSFPDGEPDVSIPSPAHFRQKCNAPSTWLALLSGNFIPVHAVLVPREAIEAVDGFDESLRACEDYDLWLRLAHRGIRFVFNDAVLARYRKSPASLSSHRRHQLNATFAALTKVSAYAKLTDQEASILNAYKRKLRLQWLKTLSPVPTRYYSLIQWYAAKVSRPMRNR